MSQAIEEKKHKDQECRRTYNSPHLIVFGALRDLTASGSGTLPEAGSGGGGPQPPPGQGGTPPGQGSYPPNDPQYRRP